MRVDTFAGPTLTAAERRTRIGFVVAAVGLFSLVVIGLFTLVTSPQETATITLAYTAGLVRQREGVTHAPILER